MEAFFGNDNVLYHYAKAIAADSGNAVDFSGASATYLVRDVATQTTDFNGSMSYAASRSPDANGNYIFYAVIQETDWNSLDPTIAYEVVISFNGGPNYTGQLIIPLTLSYNDGSCS